MTTTLVLGGVRSGKSRHAEALLADAGPVTYVAAGGPPDPADPDWSARVDAHRRRRPAHWTTRESLDLADAITHAQGPVLLDCLGVWLTRLVDTGPGWDDLAAAARVVRAACVELVDAWRRGPHDVVAVSNEVGSGVVPPTEVGRFFRDELGRLNQALASVSDRVHLVVAGRVLDLSDAPVVGGAAQELEKTADPSSPEGPRPDHVQA